MNTAPEISVIIPVYNGGVFLKEAVSSILSQTFTNFELIILNDGSTDNSEEIILSFKDERIKYVKNEKNGGLIFTLNKGLSFCKGKYIARMDQDDISFPKRFEKQVAYLNEHKNVTVLGTKLILIDENGGDKGYWNDDFETTTIEEIKTRLPKLNCIGHPTVMMRAEIISRFRYNPAFKNSEDWGLWLTMLSENCTIAKLDEVLLRYRVHEAGTTVGQNKISVSKKIIRFKWKYISHKLFTFNFKGTDKRVFRYWFIDCLKYYFPSLFSFIVKYIETDFKRLRAQKNEFYKVFDHFPNEIGSLFFFPFYHLGGAEVVHKDIVKSVVFTKPMVLFTNYSASDTLLQSFKDNAQTLCIDQLIIWPSSRKKVIELITAACIQNKSMTLFSSNSRFYYEYLKNKPNDTKAIDLIHAFMHAHEDSSEKWSLPVVDKLNARVIINLRTGKDLEKQYNINGISNDLLSRVNYISNFVEAYPDHEKDYQGQINVLYVGRGTAEKRVHLLALIAKRVKDLNLNVQFSFVGDVSSAISEDLKPFCKIYGEVKDKNELNKIYRSSHILAMASTREGFPIVIMEAMMHGTIPISTNVGGISEHVNETNGILINELEPSDFCEAFINELSKLIEDKACMKKMSEAAHKYALEHFNEKNFINSYTQLFSK